MKLLVMFGDVLRSAARSSKDYGTPIMNPTFLIVPVPSRSRGHPRRTQMPTRCAAAAIWRRRKGSLSASPRGRTFAGALSICAEAPKGATVLCMLPDTGERYLSTPLFANIPADMNEEEIAISRSTPAAQMGS